MTEKDLAVQEKPMEYQLANGDSMKLTMGMVKKYLVSGKPELVNNSELLYFMHICKARKLNPFTKDCYLIKYGSDPAAIVTSVDYFRRNARKSEDCQGWQCGIITEMENGEYRYSKGIIKKGEKLVGAWFKATPKGWSEPFELEVPLDPFIKKTRDGKITQFWRDENQPIMIRKVAECQGLRMLWGENTSGMYSPEEVTVSVHDMAIGDNVSYQRIEAEDETDTKFVNLLPEKYDKKALEDFIKATADGNGKSVDDVKRSAVKSWSAFWNAFETWSKANNPKPVELQEKQPPEADHVDNEISASDEQPPDMAAEKSALIDKALGLSATNNQRWNAIVKTLSRAGVLQSSFIQEWSLDQLMQVIDEFELIDNPDQQEQF